MTTSTYPKPWLLPGILQGMAKSQDLYRLLLKMDQVFALDFSKAAKKIRKKRLSWILRYWSS